MKATDRYSDDSFDEPRSPTTDIYKAGPCPACGEFATTTHRHISSPVACVNGHVWFRPGQTKRDSAERVTREWGVAPLDTPSGTLEKAAAAANPTLAQLQEAKQRSDQRQYAVKAYILGKLMQAKPHEFAVDHNQPGHPGITHLPTGFRLHLPADKIPPGVKQASLLRSIISRLA